MKKIKGRTHHFGPWGDWKGALERYQYEVHSLQQGLTPPPRNVEALTLENLVNTFLENRESKVASGELTQRTWNDIKRTAEYSILELGRYTQVESLTPLDFAKLCVEISKGSGLFHNLLN